MAILNLTPDSFYDGCKNITNEFLQKKIQSFKYSDIIDVGAESSRPFSNPISYDEEIKRLSIFIDIVESIKKPLSIDSYKPEVIKYALNHGFNIINDISGGGIDNSNIKLASIYNVPIIIMHMQGTPKTMQIKPEYNNIIDDIMFFFEKKIEIMKNEFHLKDDQIIIDPGIGFGKSKEDNYLILDNISKFKTLGYPVLIGLSRKSFLAINNNGPKNRKRVSLAAQSVAIANGADYIRTHDVEETYKQL